MTHVHIHVHFTCTCRYTFYMFTPTLVKHTLVKHTLVKHTLVKHTLVEHTLVKHNPPIFSTKEKEILWNNQSKKTVKKQMWADVYEGERHAHWLTFSLFQSHKRPEWRKPRENVRWKRRELVVLKIKRAEWRSERESQASHSSASVYAGVCMCECAVCVCVYM